MTDGGDQVSESFSTISRSRRAWLGVEFLTLFVGLPLLLYFRVVQVSIITALWLFTVPCLMALLRDRSFDRGRFGLNRQSLGELPRIALTFLVPAMLIALGVVWLRPDLLFGFVRQRPGLWAVVMVLYPILSVYPQGIIYRGFIFHRYRPIFAQRWAMILASALAFGFVHILLRNGLAPLMTLAGGILFAWTYDRTRSLLLAAAEHAAFGCFLFTIGLGRYFYGGAIG
jgi:membrane protease YdiL (CAAX protease family)